MRSCLTVFVALLFFAVGCGKDTTVKIKNKSNNNFGSIKIKAVTSDSYVTFSNIKKNAETEEKEWSDEDNMAVKIITTEPTTINATKSVSLIEEKVNTITIKDGTVSSEITFTNEALAPLLLP